MNERRSDRNSNSRSSLPDTCSNSSHSTLPASRSVRVRIPAKSFTDLEVWQAAHAFVLAIYRLTMTFPSDERFGLTNQFRRAAVSIAANIAEGFRKYTPADKARFLNTAEGSREECRYYCILAQDLGYGETDKLRESLNMIAGQLAAYIRKLRNS